ncbi:hypothetical protein DBV15_10280, partial [Temnothorax longispinosus]
SCRTIELTTVPKKFHFVRLLIEFSLHFPCRTIELTTVPKKFNFVRLLVEFSLHFSCRIIELTTVPEEEPSRQRRTPIGQIFVTFFVSHNRTYYRTKKVSLPLHFFVSRIELTTVPKKVSLQKSFYNSFSFKSSTKNYTIYIFYVFIYICIYKNTFFDV